MLLKNLWAVFSGRWAERCLIHRASLPQKMISKQNKMSGVFVEAVKHHYDQWSLSWFILLIFNITCSCSGGQVQLSCLHHLVEAPYGAFCVADTLIIKHTTKIICTRDTKKAAYETCQTSPVTQTPACYTVSLMNYHYIYQFLNCLIQG